MDIGRAFSYIMEDDQWLTVILLGGLILLIPIFGPIVLVGFMLETARNVAMGSPQPLPRWNNLGEKFSLGLYGLVIQLVYALPVVLLSCLSVCVIGLGGGLSSRSEGAVGGVVVLAFFCLFPLILIVSLVIQPAILAALLRYLQTGSIGAALRVGEVIAMLRRDLSSWLVLWLLQLLCGVVASLGGVFFVFGALFTSVYAQAVFGHLLGQSLARSITPPGPEGSMPPASPAL
jgi:hypothetical protein